MLLIAWLEEMSHCQDGGVGGGGGELEAHWLGPAFCPLSAFQPCDQLPHAPAATLSLP